MALHFIQRTATGRTRVHVHVEWLVIEATLVYRLIVVHRHLVNVEKTTVIWALEPSLTALTLIL